MDSKALSQIIPGAVAEDFLELRTLINKLESFEDLFVGFMLGHDNSTRFVYMSPSVEAVTGYSVSDFVSDTGFQFLYKVTPVEYHAHIVERTAFYEIQAMQADLSICDPQLMEINGGLYHRAGHAMRVRFLAVVLEYTADRNLVLSLCTWQNVNSLSERDLDLIKEQVNSILISCKRIFMRIYPEKFNVNGHPKVESNGRVKSNGHPNNGALKVVYPLYKGPEVTKKEYEVLRLISNGYSSKQIAERLKISFHTAETHRKHLLAKFEAVNSAELMKKASKVFWFE